MGFLETINEKFAASAVGKYFKIKERNSTLTQDLRGGTVTFLTVAYILAVNANILTDTPCTCASARLPRPPARPADRTPPPARRAPQGGPCISQGACKVGTPPAFQSPACQSCVEDVRLSLISATAAACIISHFLMAVVGNLPLAVCPAMGLNAYFAYTVVGYMGTGRVSYEEALAAVFVEGLIFVVISVIGVRGAIIKASEGIGIVTYNSATLVTLGGCPPGDRVYQVTTPLVGGDIPAAIGTMPTCVNIDPTNSSSAMHPNPGLFTPSGTYQCLSPGVMRSATMWLGIAGGMLMTVLMAKNVRGAIMIGIAFVTFISWIPKSATGGGNQAAYLQYPPGGCTSEGDPELIVGGTNGRGAEFRVAKVPSASATAGKFDFSGFSNGDLWLALITFLYVDFFDATGTLYAMANFLSQYIPSFIKEDKTIERQTLAFTVDGLSIVIGSCLGSSPITIYVESASGIREGARTGVAALAMSFWFFVALWFSPLLASIPGYATGPALILVGAMMVSRGGRGANVCGGGGYIIIHTILFAWYFLEAKLGKGDKPVGAKETWKVVRQKTFAIHEDDRSFAFGPHGTSGGDESPKNSEEEPVPGAIDKA
eukprot:scaffold21.g2223.t1